jgi:hypothetical protein
VPHKYYFGHKFEYDPENKVTQNNWKIRQGKKEMDKGKGKEKIKKSREIK